MTNSDTADDFAGFLEQGEVLHGLPPCAYTSKTFFTLEQAKLLPAHWVFVGFAHDLIRSGDVIPLNVAGRPIILLRNRENRIQAFHNVCRHRSAKLVEEAGNVGRLLKCPYHAWVYGLDGSLRAAPYFGGLDQTPPPGFKCSDYSLHQISTVVWHDWIFINLDGNAIDFAEFIAPMERRLADINLPKLQLVTVLDFPAVACNWKFLIENFIEPYHVPVVHSTTTEQPLQAHKTLIEGHCLGSLVDLPESAKSNSTADALSVSSRYLTLFPNFVLGSYYPDQIGVHLNIPISPGVTHQRRAIYLTNDQPVTADRKRALSKLWSDVHQEDHGVCIRLQSGRESEVAADGGLLSPYWEDSLRRYQEMIYTEIYGKRLEPNQFNTENNDARL